MTTCDINESAAPELLRALQAIINDGVHCDVVPHLHRQALDAIAKASAPSSQALTSKEKLVRVLVAAVKAVCAPGWECCSTTEGKELEKVLLECGYIERVDA